MSQQDFNVGLYPIVRPQVEEQEPLVFHAPPAVDLNKPVSQIINPIVSFIKNCFCWAIFIIYVYIHALGILYFFTE